jgi:EpsI family protein
LAIAFTVLFVGAGGKLLLAHQISDLRNRERATLARPFAEFPRTVGLWTSSDIATNPQILRDIKSDDHLEREYVHPTGERLVLWFNYSDRSRDQYHYPTVCLEGAGWEEEEARRQQIVVGPETNGASAGMQPVPMIRMFFTKQAEPKYVHYWYYLLGEDPVDRAMRRLSQYARVFLRGRQNASVTVEVFSASPKPDRKLLDEFAAQVAVELHRWMPPKTEASCELGATY